MPRMSKKRKLELSFFLNDRGRVLQQNGKSVVVYFFAHFPPKRHNGNYVVSTSPMRSSCRAWTAPLSTV